jgi:hypothetical protein
MSKQSNNPFLKQLVTDISRRANQGRLDINWGVLAESRKKKAVKEGNVINQVEQDEKKRREVDDTSADEKPADDVVPQGADKAPPADVGIHPDQGKSSQALPPMDKGGEQSPVDKGGDAPAAPSPEEAPAPAAEEPSQEDSDQAQDDATKAKAELEKAKAEKDHAEQEIKKQSFVHLVSAPGVHFLLGKLVDHAFKTNTTDSLASEMTSKLKIQTPEDFSNFVEEMAPYKSIPGVAELLAAMKGMATKQPDTAGEPEVASRVDNEPSTE